MFWAFGGSWSEQKKYDRTNTTSITGDCYGSWHPYVFGTREKFINHLLTNDFMINI